MYLKILCYYTFVTTKLHFVHLKYMLKKCCDVLGQIWTDSNIGLKIE